MPESTSIECAGNCGQMLMRLPEIDGWENQTLCEQCSAKAHREVVLHELIDRVWFASFGWSIDQYSEEWAQGIKEILLDARAQLDIAPRGCP